ncbi:MAG: Zn-ribbon domain-containing OB-fold protein [Chloroflexota bacterium]
MTSYVTLPAYVATIDRRYRLVGNKCKGCGAIIFPARLICPECNSNNMEDFPLSGKGKIFTYTMIARYAAPGEFDDQQSMDGAFMVGIVKLEEGPLTVAQLTDCEVKPEAVEIGTDVEVVFRRLYEQEGITRYCYKFRPVSK